MVLCRKCLKSWRIHLDDQGAVIVMVEVSSYRDPSPGLRVISGPTDWFEGPTVKISLEDEQASES